MLVDWRICKLVNLFPIYLMELILIALESLLVFVLVFVLSTFQL